jgi:hypothetical protein
VSGLHSKGNAMSLRYKAVAATRHALNVLRSADGRGGEIHSAYRRTINLRFPPEQLVSLHGGQNLVAPFGIALGRRFGSPAYEKIGPGFRAAVADGLVRIPEAGLEVVLAEAAVWEPKARPVSLPSPAAARHAEVLTAILLQHEDPDGLAGLVDGGDATPLLRRARPCAVQLAEGLSQGDTSALLAGAEPLLGLGPGLTPSGDDFLGGFMGTALLALPDAAPLLQAAGHEMLRLAQTKTTLLSRAFLAHALRGALAPPLDALLATILEAAGRESVAREAHAATTLGHTSGTDMLAGMVFALRGLGQAAP